MALREDFLLELKYRNNIESVVSGYVSLKKRGSNLIGLCPFHNEKTPSFTLYPENGSFYCFGCGVGGDVFSFIMRMENLDYMDAVKLLAERVSLPMPEENTYDDRLFRLKTEMLKANKLAARFFCEKLLEDIGKTSRNYLTGRGLSVKTIRNFGIGYAPDSWDALYRYLREKGISDEALLEANLCGIGKNGKYYDRFRNRVMFPVIDVRGNVVAFSGRNLPGVESGGKYVNTRDTHIYKKGNMLFGLHTAKNHCSERAILVEGNMDVIALHQAGFCNTVGSLGTAFTPEQARLLSKYTKEVVIMLDSDAAGQKATDKVISILSEANVSIRILRLPDCKDPDEYIKKHSAAKLQALLDGAKTDIEYMLLRAADGLSMEDDDAKITYLKRATELLAGVDDSIAVDLYAGRLADKYAIAKETLMLSITEAKKKKRKQQYRQELKEIVQVNPRTAVNPERALHKKAAAAEETINSILIYHPDLFERHQPKLTEESFVTDFGRRLFAAISSMYRKGYTFDISLLGDGFTAEEIGSIVALYATKRFHETPELLLEDCINTLKSEKLKIQTEEQADTTDGWEQQMAFLAKQKK
ncbi:MAG: DNA primase [Clostridia bacterium]|nr:DNA primase [Clostridia bacterium]MBQ7289176.1 DNA primase [Clostridia bacterium]